MKHYKLFLLPLFLFFLSSTAMSQKSTDVVSYVRPIIGASTANATNHPFSALGKTFPGPATPFGLVQLSPDTKTGGDNGPGYSWHHKTLEGFSFIHMSGIGWYGDFGNFLVTPTTGRLQTNSGYEEKPETGYRSRYSHETEVAELGYYAVTSDDYKIRTELTSLPHSGIMRMTFPQCDTSRISIDLARRIGGSASEQYISVVNDTTIQGWMRCESKDGGWGNGNGNVNYTVYFYCQLSKPMKQFGTWNARITDRFAKRDLSVIESDEFQKIVSQAQVTYGCRELRGNHIGFFTEFDTKENEQVLLKAGISFVSIAGAKENLTEEMTDWNFDNIRFRNNELWREAMKNIQIQGGTEEDKIVFYTALYHTMIDPRSTSDVNGNYIGGDGEIHTTKEYVYRTIFSGWDVFRSQFPLQTLINPRMVNDEINSLISLAETSKKYYLPRWEIMNSYSGCMVGNPAVSVIVDAYNKGIRQWDTSKGYEYCRNSVEKFTNEPYGYTPRNISVTLEYAYTDWCVSQFATLTRQKKDAKLYRQRSLNYRNIWCDSVNWFRAKEKEGAFVPWNNEIAYDFSCEESNPLQQGWFVPHDIYGFIDQLGHEAFTKKLTAFFDRSSKDFFWNEYYNHPNEPVHQVPFMFAYTGNSWLTQKWTRKICKGAYGTGVDGLCGNEDVGQMSAWYILAAMGIHPVNPGDNIYVITSPVFDKATIHLDPDFYKGKTFSIVAENNSSENVYIQKVALNGKSLSRMWLSHDEIVKGGELKLTMGAQPNKELGRKNLPPSFGRSSWSKK